MARETVLLHDMNPFPQGERPRAQQIDGLQTFEMADMRAMLRQRASLRQRRIDGFKRAQHLVQVLKSM